MAARSVGYSTGEPEAGTGGCSETSGVEREESRSVVALVVGVLRAHGRGCRGRVVAVHARLGLLPGHRGGADPGGGGVHHHGHGGVRLVPGARAAQPHRFCPAPGAVVRLRRRGAAGALLPGAGRLHRTRRSGPRPGAGADFDIRAATGDAALGTHRNLPAPGAGAGRGPQRQPDQYAAAATQRSPVILAGRVRGRARAGGRGGRRRGA